MGFKPLNRPNNFMYGAKPWEPVIYDENITPLEQLNKLSYKLNEIIGDDTNVKGNVDKLLGVWKDVFMAKAGYIPAIETIYSENPLDFTLTGFVNIDEPYELMEGKYIDIDDRYKSIELQCGWTSGKEPENNTSFVNMVWEYWDGSRYVPYQMNTDVSFATSTVYLPTKGDEFQYRVKCQNKHYTSYAYIDIYVTDFSDISLIGLFTENDNWNNERFTENFFKENIFTVQYESTIKCNVECIVTTNGYIRGDVKEKLPLENRVVFNNVANNRNLIDAYNSENNIALYTAVGYGDTNSVDSVTCTIDIHISNIRKDKHFTKKYKLYIEPLDVVYNNNKLNAYNELAHTYVGTSNTFNIVTKTDLQYLNCYYLALDYVDTGGFILLNSISGILDYTECFKSKKNWNDNNSGYGLIYKQLLILEGLFPIKYLIIERAYYGKPEDDISNETK